MQACNYLEAVFDSAAISNASSYFRYFDLNPDVDHVSCVLRMGFNELLSSEICFIVEREKVTGKFHQYKWNMDSLLALGADACFSNQREVLNSKLFVFMGTTNLNVL